MLTVIADTSALAVAAESGLLELLPIHFERMILPPTVVDELVEIEVIDALVAGAVERIIEVVSLTREDEALSDELCEQIAARSTVADGAVHRGEAEGLALMERADLGAALFLCDDLAAIRVAQERQTPVRSFGDFMAEAQGFEGDLTLPTGERRHEPDEPVLHTSPVALSPSPHPAARMVQPAAPALRPSLPSTVELDEETVILLGTLVEQGIGRDASDVVRRAVRGLAVALSD